VQDIANAWKGLETSEKAFEEWLLSEMMRYVTFVKAAAKGGVGANTAECRCVFTPFIMA